MRRLTIDPGVSGTGWARWTSDWKLIDHGIIKPLTHRYTTASELEIWKLSACEISIQVKSLCSGLVRTEIFIEYPSAFGGGVAVQSGAVVKLATLVGLICGMCGVKFELVPVNDWKGQMPKDVVIKRIKRLLPGCKATSHDWDAIGIGLYKKGVL